MSGLSSLGGETSKNPKRVKADRASRDFMFNEERFMTMIYNQTPHYHRRDRHISSSTSNAAPSSVDGGPIGEGDNSTLRRMPTNITFNRIHRENPSRRAHSTFGVPSMETNLRETDSVPLPELNRQFKLMRPAIRRLSSLHRRKSEESKNRKSQH